MVITEDRSAAREPFVVGELVSGDVAVEDRPRDAQGHCWDGRTCDHADHSTYSTIHFIR
jgi:hypothetical protein